MKKIFVFLLVALFSFPIMGKGNKKKQTDLEKAKIEANAQFSYTAGYIFTMYLMTMGEDMSETLREYFDAESFAKGFSDGLFNKEMEVDGEEMFEKFYTLYHELRKEEKQKNNGKRTEEIARILEHPDFAHMEKLNDNIRYEIINPGTGELLPKDETFLVRTKLTTTTGRILGETKGNDYDKINYYSLDSSLSKLFEEARIGFHCRVLYTSEDILDDEEFEEGELPASIIELEIMGLSESSEDEYDGENWEDEYEQLKEQRRKEYMEQVSEIFQRPEYVHMQEIGDEVRYEIYNPGEGEIIPEDKAYLYCLKTLSSTGNVLYQSLQNDTNTREYYSESPMGEVLKDARVGMHFKLVQASESAYLVVEDELPIYIYEYEILGFP